MKIRKVSAIIFYDDKNRILIQDRTGHKQAREEYGFWGGGIEDKETPEQALVREIKEELGYDLKDYKFIGIFSGQHKDFKLIMYTFISKLINISKFNQKEGRNMKLVDLETAEKLLTWSWDREVIKNLKKIL